MVSTGGVITTVFLLMMFEVFGVVEGVVRGVVTGVVVRGSIDTGENGRRGGDSLVFLVKVISCNNSGFVKRSASDVLRPYLKCVRLIFVILVVDVTGCGCHWVFSSCVLITPVFETGSVLFVKI